MPGALTDLSFDNAFVAALPADPIAENATRQVLGAAYSRVRPTPVAAPTLLAVSDEMAAELGLDPHADPALWAEVFSGNRLLDGMDPVAVRYGGHQFGHWAGQLGDGRAISLGEVIAPSGQRWELQLKGAGPTPYSRRADGRAVLRSSVREFLCSEAMFHLGVPTTRALTLVGTGEPVWRDMFYDGRPEQEPGAIVCRVAPSFVRFGNFEILAATGEVELLGRLLDQVVGSHFPDLAPLPRGDKACAWLGEIARRTAEMVVHWMRVGFVHGVMNTDNLSVLGLTIDYGPYGWLEGFDPDWTPNTTDAERRRYRYGQQPAVAHWNLVRLASALIPLVGSAEPLEEAVQQYVTTVERLHPAMWLAKIGVSGERDGDQALVDDLLGLLVAHETDMTLFFRGLSRVPPDGDASARLAPVQDAWYGEPPRAVREDLLAWLDRWLARVGTPDRAAMDAVNPRVVLRNWLAQQAIDQATAGDPSEIGRLLEALRRPYDDDPRWDAYVARRPEWARHRAGCSMLSCSS